MRISKEKYCTGKSRLVLEGENKWLKFKLSKEYMYLLAHGRCDTCQLTPKQAIKLAKKICEFYDVAVIPKKLQKRTRSSRRK
jgi:hypothetical protein